MLSKQLGPYTRRRMVTGTLALLAAPSVRRAAAQQPVTEIAPHLAALYEKAKPEGEVSIWGPGAASLDWIPAEFAKRFPGIKVTWFGDQQASSRLIAEAHAGRHVADAWTFSLGGTLEIQKRGLLQKTDWRAFGAQGHDIFFDGEAVGVFNVVYVPVFARNRLSRDEVPSRWTGMADPVWTDKLVSGTFLLPRLGGYLAIEWGLGETERWIRTLMDQRRMLVTTAPVSGFLASGERQLAVAETGGGAFMMQRDGLDVAYRVMDIVPATQFIYAVTRKAPHPNAARLLCAWLITPEAKQLYEKVAGQIDIRSNPDAQLSRDIREAGAKVIYEDLESMGQRADYYRRLMSVVRGQG